MSAAALYVLFLVSLGGLNSPPSTQPAGPIDIGYSRQVFVDRHFLADAKGIELTVHPPRKTGESNIRVDRPWETGGLGPYSSVLKVGGKYLMWYHAMDNKLWDSSPSAGAICLATSSDGIRWEKPDLGLIEYKGSRQNNIVIGHGAAGLEIGQDGGMVFIDPNAATTERFRMVCRFGNNKDVVNLLSSGDGVHWSSTHTGVVTARPETKGHHLDSQNVIFWDDQLGKYVCYVRRNLKGTEAQGRSVARGESARLDGFGAVQDMPVMLSSDETDRSAGLTLIDYYSSAAIKYPWAQSAYFLFPQAYYHYTKQLHEFEKQSPTNAGAIDTQFAASRDGVHWERFDRRPFVPLGMKGDFDCHSARILYGIVPDLAGQELYMYYRGSDWLHGWDRDDRNRKLLTEKGLGASQDVTIISRLTLRRDGFVSARADFRGGEFVSPPLRFSGSRLLLNIDTSATGNAVVELQDASGHPLEGYRLQDCDRIHTCNQIDRLVTWRGNADVRRLASQAVRLRCVITSADLYAFQFANPDATDRR
jgi:hypothetical protein